MECYSWSMVLKLARFGKKIRNTWKVKMWCWRRMEKISWTDRVRNEELLRVKQDGNILQSVEVRLTGLVTSCVGTAF